MRRSAGEGVLPIPGYRKRLFAVTHAAVEDALFGPLKPAPKKKK